MIIKSNKNIVNDELKVNFILFSERYKSIHFFVKIWFVFKRKEKTTTREHATYNQGLML